MFFSNNGYCHCCEQHVEFIAENAWFRDSYQCSHCGSLPRERVLAYCLEKEFPQWRDMRIHECSPVWRGGSRKIKEQCRHYTPTMYTPTIRLGIIEKGFRNENLEKLTFADNTFDLHITQDVFEHLFYPAEAFKEIARTLRPGGGHLFTVPLVRKKASTLRRAIIHPLRGEIKYLNEPDYHTTHLVTRDWGYDICHYIKMHCGLETKVFSIEDIDLGIKAELNEVLITYKPKL